MPVALNTSRPALPTSGRPPHSYLVGQDDEGHWVAVEATGLAGGIFRSCRDAVRYACLETGCRPGDVPLAAGPIPFRLS